MNFISTFEELDKLYEDFSSEEPIEEGIFGIKTAKDRQKEVDAENAKMRQDRRAKYDAAKTKALENTPVVVQIWRDKSHAPQVIDYFGSHMAAQAVEKRHAFDVDKSTVYRYMTAKEAQDIGALVSLPSGYIDKYLNETMEEPLIEGKIVDTIKKVGTRLGADVSTIVRCFAESSGIDALYELALDAENKAVLKALKNGNETVLNTLTKADIEELEQAIKDYEEEKKAKKSGVKEQLTEDSAAEKITWELFNNLGPVVKQTFGSKEEALMYANKYKIDNATLVVGTRYINGEYLGNIEHKIKNFGNNDYFNYNIVESCNKNLQEDSDVEIEIVEDEVKQVVLECKKCGALVVIDEADLKNSEDSDLVNIDDECKFCSEKEGYSVIGTLVPYEAEVEEETEEELA